MIEINKSSFFGLGVSIFQINELEDYIIDAISNKNTRVLYGHALWTVPMMNKYPEIFVYGEKADVLVTDGRIFYVLCKLFRIPLKVELSIPQLVLLILNLASEHKYAVFLLGSNQKENFLACQNIRRDYPGIKKCLGHHGYFGIEEENSIIQEINNEFPQIILIGMTSPKKEIIAIDWKERINANIIIPCGGMIDVLAGKTKLTPKLIKKLGLASFYRFFQEPKRLYKRYSYIYGFLFLSFIPTLVWNVVILRKKDFSIPKYYNIS